MKKQAPEMSEREFAARPNRGIDHVVLCVRDLDHAAARYEKLGFTVTPTGVHPWGTANRLVQLHGCFLELLCVADPSRIEEHEPQAGRFSFGAYNRDTLARRQGVSMLVFESGDAQADRDEFAAKGLADLQTFDFERMAKLPSGEERKVAFSLAFVPPFQVPEAVFFTCQQHAPDLFWKPEYQAHRNHAITVDEAVMVATDPTELAPLLGSLQAPEAVSIDANGIVTAETARGRIRVMTRDRFADWYGPLPADCPEGPHFAGLRICVPDLGDVEAHLGSAKVPANWARAGLVVSADDLYGCALAFAQA